VERLAELAILRISDPRTRLLRLLDRAEWGVDLGSLAVGWNRPGLQNLLPAKARIIAAGERRLAFSPSRWQALEQRMEEGLLDFHARFAGEMGPEASRARRMYLPKLPAPAFSALVEDLLAAGRVKRSGPWLHLPGHQVNLTPQEEALFQHIRPWLLESPYDPPWIRELARRCEADEGRMRQLMQKLARRGAVFQVVRDLFYAVEALADLAAIVTELEQTEAGANAAALRDRTGIGRKRCIQILEFFDRVGYTRRIRNTHRLRNAEMFRGQRLALD
jgi:selenocysteine-specific elongation factor